MKYLVRMTRAPVPAPGGFLAWFIDRAPSATRAALNYETSIDEAWTPDVIEAAELSPEMADLIVRAWARRPGYERAEFALIAVRT